MKLSVTMVEADFVFSGSVVKDKIGEQVASDLVTLIGLVFPSGAGTIAVDDKRVRTGNTHHRKRNSTIILTRP
jgi:predicted Zn-dependent protease